MFNKKKKNNKGFTLVELLVVIAIIGILAVVAVPSLFKQIDKAKATQVVANVNAIKTEIMTEYANGNTDSEVATAANTFATSTSISEKKLDEKYGVTPVAESTIDGKTIPAHMLITVTMTNKDTVAKNIADQLGTNASASGSVVTYKVMK